MLSLSHGKKSTKENNVRLYDDILEYLKTGKYKYEETIFEGHPMIKLLINDKDRITIELLANESRTEICFWHSLDEVDEETILSKVNNVNLTNIEEGTVIYFKGKLIYRYIKDITEQTRAEDIMSQIEFLLVVSAYLFMLVKTS